MVTVIHNGYDIKYLRNMDEVQSYIESVLEPHKHLEPKLIFDRTFKGNKYTDGSQIRIMRYKYRTLYEEDFIIEF
ncbi:MAG: hypothetical protein J6A59_07845 [Lachnospiraceae bacterium]|nr:hypothetical protein [Lachnospiraceae bacterium]